MAGSLKPNFVYLAGPIDQVEEEVALGWRFAVGEELAANGIASFNPYLAFHGTDRAHAERVRDINDTAILHSDVLLANLLPGPSLGTIREIEFAKHMDIDVVIIGKRAEESLYTFDCDIVTNLEEAVTMIIGGEYGSCSNSSKRHKSGDKKGL